MLLRENAWRQMSDAVHQGSNMMRTLALASVQFFGQLESAAAEPTPAGDDGAAAREHDTVPRPIASSTLAAGLPHFSSGIMRCWGRDTFIAIRGLLLLTGRFHEARHLLLTFAAALRHGLIPNLLDGLRRPRYNARDATWWFLYAVQCYCALADERHAVLDARVVRRFPYDDQAAHKLARERHEPLPVQSLADVIQEIMQRHASGIAFREWGAGAQLDRNMTDAGFNVAVRLDPQTGLLYGGNAQNCGTWMDKMGESDSAGNRGVPASPRDGCAIEIAALCKATVRWLARLHASGQWPHAGVTISVADQQTRLYTYNEWNSALQQSFERNFWVPLDAADDARFGVETGIVHRRGIFRDTHGATARYADYQLRPNWCIAVVVAPELFSWERAHEALELTQRHLLSPGIGMRTLDPADWRYTPDYDNSVDGGHELFFTARGFNYHQGPEWVWLTGYFIRAKLLIDRHRVGLIDTAATATQPSGDPALVDASIADVREILSRLWKALQASPWRSLPELTCRDGAPCRDACPAQAWSVGAVLEALHDLQEHRRHQHETAGAGGGR